MTPKPSKSLPASSEESPRLSATPREMRKVEFSAWTRTLRDEAIDREVGAIDGKTVRRSFDRGRAQAPLHLVSAWASERGLSLGQRAVDGPSNESTAIRELLDALDLLSGGHGYWWRRGRPCRAPRRAAGPGR